MGAGGIILLGGIYVFKGMLAEIQRGKTTGVFREAILDDLPKKKPRALYLGEKVPDWEGRQPAQGQRAGPEAPGPVRRLVRPRVPGQGHHRGVQGGEGGPGGADVQEDRGPGRPEFLEQIKAEIKRLHKKGELHVFSPVEIEEIQIVHFEAPAAKAADVHGPRLRQVGRLPPGRQVRRGAPGGQEVLRLPGVLAVPADQGPVGAGVRFRPSGDMDTVLGAKNVLAPADLDKFAKTADEELLREFVAG